MTELELLTLVPVAAFSIWGLIASTLLTVFCIIFVIAAASQSDRIKYIHKAADGTETTSYRKNISAARTASQWLIALVAIFAIGISLLVVANK